MHVEDAVAAIPVEEETLMRYLEDQYGSLYDRASYG
jgi:hypothetical protein